MASSVTAHRSAGAGAGHRGRPVHARVPHAACSGMCGTPSDPCPAAHWQLRHRPPLLYLIWSPLHKQSTVHFLGCDLPGPSIPGATCPDRFRHSRTPDALRIPPRSWPASSSSSSSSSVLPASTLCPLAPRRSSPCDRPPEMAAWLRQCGAARRDTGAAVPAAIVRRTTALVAFSACLGA